MIINFGNILNKSINVTKGPALWEEAKALIPGGNQLLSKRSERFLPGFWPAYYQKAKGAEVWDMDGNRFYDFAAMGVGSCVLGYADKDVNKKVHQAVKLGSMSSLNSYEEILLAKELIRLHPWSGMCRFARSGGEACAIAIRIARAHTNRPNIAFCGYHGWHDWYISSNLASRTNLDNQLLPGLSSRGLPRKLKSTAFPFQYNQIGQLESIFKKYGESVGTIIMEPVRDSLPKNGFLKKVRSLADQWKCVLIFDEITSGFRLCCGGSHKKLGIYPDIAVLGKALGNGYPITAIIGKKNVMDAAQETFISSTFWTERVGFVAALATIKKFENQNVEKNLIASGKKIKSGWKEASKCSKIQISVSGIEPLPNLEFLGENQKLKITVFTQEMLKKGFLASSGPYTSFAHSESIVDKYNQAAAEVFHQIAKAEHKGELRKLLKGVPASSGFQRLTSIK